MASRFVIVDEEYIKELKDKTKHEDMNDSMKWWKISFKEWANERDLQANLEEYENDALNQQLSQWILVKLRINTCSKQRLGSAFYITCSVIMEKWVV